MERVLRWFIITFQLTFYMTHCGAMERYLWESTKCDYYAAEEHAPNTLLAVIYKYT